MARHRAPRRRPWERPPDAEASWPPPPGRRRHDPGPYGPDPYGPDPRGPVPRGPERYETGPDGAGRHGPGQRGPYGRRWRSGSEPVTARSALRLRLLLSVLFVPVFLAGTALFAHWASRSGPGDAPGEGSLRTLALMSGVLAVLALVDLLVVMRRRRQERAAGRDGGPGNGGPGDGPEGP